MELYFQPKVQAAGNAFQVFNKLVILQSILDEKMFDYLRTKKQLGYIVECTRKNTNGVLGITLTIQSSKYNPLKLQREILQFIDVFYYDIFDEKVFTTYKEGCLSRKRNGFSGFEDEVRYLYERIRCFSLAPDQEIAWDARDKEISTL